jgi:Flp pilus assembly protein TadG
MSAFFTAITRLFRDKSGNVAFIFALICIPVVSVIGCAIDYSMATRMKAKMQSAADAASVAAVSLKSPGYTQAAAMTGNGTVSAAITDADLVFDGNMSPIPTTSYGNLTRTSLVTKTGVQLTSSVQFSAQVPVTFMKLLGYQNLSISGTSSSSASLPPYLDFYLALDVSGSMGLPSTPAEAGRLQSLNPDNFVQYPSGCTLACHFQPLKSACVDPPVTAPAAPPRNPPTTTTSYTQQYNTNNACMGYAYSRVSPTALASLINSASTAQYPKQVPGLPVQMLSGLPSSLNTDPNFGLPAVSSCPTAGSANCIQLRLDAVGFALNATQSANGVSGLLELAQNKEAATGVPNEFRIGLYPFITDIDASYAPLTSSINSSSSTPGTINYAAKNLASELDTNMNSNLGSGGTHIDNSLNSINNLITSVGDGSSSTNTQPYVFLVTDGAQDNQYKDVPNGSWHGSNWATVLNDTANTYPNICQKLKNRNIIVSVLYIPYQTISPVNTSFANDEDDHANWNIPNITNTANTSGLQTCASPPDAGGTYFYTANTPADIQASLNAMFNHSLQTAHITN